MEVLYKILLFVHILAGFSVIAAGLLAFIFRKGGKAHAISGNLFAYGMYTVAATAWIICLFFKFNLFLFILGIFSFYLTYTGQSVLKRKKPGQETIWDQGLAWLTFLSGIIMIGYGIYLLTTSSHFNPFTILSVVFGSLTAANGREDIQMFRGVKDRSFKKWWLTYHVSRMGGAYIAATTAFLVFGARSMVAGHPYAWVVWLIPTLVISPLLALVNRKIRGKQKRKLSVAV